MHSGGGDYPHDAPRPNRIPQLNAGALPSKPFPSNSLLDRIESSPSHPPQNTFYLRSPADVTMAHVEEPAGLQIEETQNDSGALPSEETVEAFLASVLSTNVVASHLQAPSTASASQPPAPLSTTKNSQSIASTPAPAAQLPSSPTPGTHSNPALLSTTRALLLPHLIANAQARGRGQGGKDAGWGSEWGAEVERRARELVTDEWCEEMIAHARRARAEMRRRACEGADAQKASGEERVEPKSADAETENVEMVVEEDAGVSDVKMDVSQDQEGSRTDKGVEQNGREGSLAPLGETILESAARVLQDFIASTPQPRHRETLANSAQVVGPSHTVDPSTSDGPIAAAQKIPSVVKNPRAESGLWAIRVGSRVPEIATVTFDVSDIAASAAQRWARRYIELDSNKMHVVVHLLCLPALAVATVNSSSAASTDPSAVSDALWNIQTRWPPKGSLIVEVNGGDAKHARTLLPTDLDTTSGPVDVTPHIRPGANTIRLIQLRDQSEWVFVVHMGTPRDEDRAPFAAVCAEAREWAAFVARASAQHGAMAMAVPPV